MECPICLDKEAKIELLPCKHKVCMLCLWKTRDFKQTSCPVCRTTVCSTPSLVETRPSRTREITVKVSAKVPGLTIERRGDGLYCKFVSRFGSCFDAGIERGHRILAINGLKPHGHSHAIEILDTCHKHGMDVTLSIARRRKPKFLTYC